MTLLICRLSKGSIQKGCKFTHQKTATSTLQGGFLGGFYVSNRHQKAPPTEGSRYVLNPFFEILGLQIPSEKVLHLLKIPQNTFLEGIFRVRGPSERYLKTFQVYRPFLEKHPLLEVDKLQMTDCFRNGDFVRAQVLWFCLDQAFAFLVILYGSLICFNVGL